MDCRQAQILVRHACRFSLVESGLRAQYSQGVRDLPRARSQDMGLSQCHCRHCHCQTQELLEIRHFTLLSLRFSPSLLVFVLMESISSDVTIVSSDRPRSIETQSYLRGLVVIF